MTKKTHIYAVALFLTALSFLCPAHLAAQSTGRVDFQARVAPTGGQPEPVRQLPFYLLRKSFEDIRTEALQSAPAPDLNKFVDGLEVTPELKAWMKKHHSVQLSGEEFTKSLTADDIVDTPEYFKAYMMHNAAYRGMGFPEPKFKEKDRKSNPEKFQAQKDQYDASVRKFIAATPDSVKGMDLELVDLNPNGLPSNISTQNWWMRTPCKLLRSATSLPGRIRIWRDADRSRVLLPEITGLACLAGKRFQATFASTGIYVLQCVRARLRT
jgi:hypothetical protein